MRATVSTAEVERKDKLALWMDLVCAQLVQVDCRTQRHDTNFFGAISKLVLPDLEIAYIEASKQAVKRTPAQASRASDESYLVNVQIAGTSVVRQNGREAKLRPGDCAMYSSSRPYEFDFDGDFRQMVIVLSAETVRKLSPRIDRQCAITLDRADAATQFLIKLASSLDDLAEALPGHIVNAATHTLAQTLVAAVGGQDQTGLTAFHLARAKEIILRHLADTELDVRLIASTVGLSVSHLHRLFASDGCNVMQWVWERRLEACKRDLEDTDQPIFGVATIAYRWGFKNASHFSKAFRTRFGVSPREWRETSRSVLRP
jgi:AraC-like DNA-binding protein